MQPRSSQPTVTRSQCSDFATSLASDVADCASPSCDSTAACNSSTTPAAVIKPPGFLVFGTIADLALHFSCQPTEFTVFSCI
jgi:hypothetical protein